MQMQTFIKLNIIDVMLKAVVEGVMCSLWWYLSLTRLNHVPLDYSIVYISTDQMATRG